MNTAILTVLSCWLCIGAQPSLNADRHSATLDGIPTAIYFVPCDEVKPGDLTALVCIPWDNESHALAIIAHRGDESRAGDPALIRQTVTADYNLDGVVGWADFGTFTGVDFGRTHNFSRVTE